MRASKAALIAGALACLAAGLFMSSYLFKTIVASLVRTTNAIRRLSEGDETVELPGQSRNDEIGDLVISRLLIA